MALAEYLNASHQDTKLNGLSGKRKLEDVLDKPDGQSALDATSPVINGAKRRKIIAPSTSTVRRVKKIRQLNNVPTRHLDVLVFGCGENGELGLGNKIYDKKDPTNARRPRLNHLLDMKDVGIVQIAVGGMHCAALTHDGRVLTWGVNDSRALGRESKWEPAEEPDEQTTDLNPIESSPAPAEGLSDIGSSIVQIAATDGATFVLTRTGFVYGWGIFYGSDGVYGFLREKISAGKKNNHPRIQTKPIQIDGLKDVRDIVAGVNHVLALTDAGDVYAWGTGQQAELGRRLVQRHQYESLIPRMVDLPKKGIVKIFAGFNHSFALDKQGQVWTWGLNNFGQTGIGANEDNLHVGIPTIVEGLRGYNIRHIAGGFHHSVACTEDGQVLAWGRCDDSQVGLDVSTLPKDHFLFDSRGKPRILLQPTVIPDITATFVAAGIDDSFAIKPDGKVLAWGYSDSCRTGLGTDDTVESPTEVIGKAVADKVFTFVGCGGQFSVICAQKMKFET